MSRLEEMMGTRRRSATVARMRGLARGGVAGAADNARAEPAAAAAERCDICGAPLPDEHRHLLQLEERRIVCACEPCWALHSGDPEHRPVGARTVWLSRFDLDDELWGRFQIPIGLAFFMRSSVTGGVVAFYPSPAGATESELSLEAWQELGRRNPILAELEADAEALIVNRLTEPPQCAIAPIDSCYELVGLIKSRWQGISGGAALSAAVPEFFSRLRQRADAAGISA
jgi:Family of unknown function (DUF5947)